MSPNEVKYLNEIETYTKNKYRRNYRNRQSKIESGKVKFEKLQKALVYIKEENQLKNKETLNSEVTKIYLNVGKKKKIRVIDIVGAFSNIDGIN